jgi:hypothetical protein
VRDLDRALRKHYGHQTSSSLRKYWADWWDPTHRYRRACFPKPVGVRPLPLHRQIPDKVTGAGPGFVATDAVGRLCLSLGWRVALPSEKPRSPVIESSRQLRLTNGLQAADVVG